MTREFIPFLFQDSCRAILKYFVVFNSLDNGVGGERSCHFAAGLRYHAEILADSSSEGALDLAGSCDILASVRIEKKLRKTESQLFIF
jgi:hypothetical protein